MTIGENSHINKKLGEIRDLQGGSGIAQQQGSRNALSAIVVACSCTISNVVDSAVVVADGQRRAIISSVSLFLNQPEY